MTTQYLRFAAISGEGSSEQIDVSNLRCRFEINPRPQLSPSGCILKITNLSEAHALRFVKNEFKKITIDAGYEGGHGVLFKGNVVYGVYGRESPTDTLTTIWANDGDQAHNSATVNTTLAPGSTPNDHLNVALQAMGQFGVTKGYVGPSLSAPVYSRAVTLYGMARDVIQQVARSANAFAFYDQEQLQIVKADQSKPGSVVKLNSRSGLIGMPTQTTEGIFARCLINPQIRRAGQVYIDQKDVIPGSPTIDPTTGSVMPGTLAPIASDGLYTVFKIDISGDTRGQPWYMDLAMVPAHGLGNWSGGSIYPTYGPT